MKCGSGGKFNMLSSKAKGAHLYGFDSGRQPFLLLDCRLDYRTIDLCHSREVETGYDADASAVLA